MIVPALALFLWLGSSTPVRSEVVATATADSLDLSQCYELAKKQSETLQISVEQIEQIEQQYRELIGSVLPNLALNASQKWQEVGAPGTPSSFIASSNPQVNLTLTQPLFSGFREYAGMRSYKYLGKAAELQLKFANEQLFQNVSNSFYVILSLEKNLEDERALLGFTEDHVADLRKREELGKSRVSEVLTTESQAAAVKAQIESVKGQIATSRELLSFLIGRDASSVVLQDTLPAIPQLEPEVAVLQKAESRSDVRAAEQTEASQREQIKIAWGNWYPQLGFVGDYYLDRYSLYLPIRWDAAFNLSLPIFSGGSMLAQVRFAESQWRSAKESSSLALRQARMQIRTDYLVLQAAIAQSRTLAEAYEKARESYKLELREYNLGIVDNLTVLQGLNDMQNAKITMDQTAIQIKTDLLQLKVATEELP